MAKNRKFVKGAVLEVLGALIGLFGFYAHEILRLSGTVGLATRAFLVIGGLVLAYKGLRLQTFSHSAFKDEEPEDDNIYKKFSRVLGMLKSILDIFI